ncbi:MAG TPA: chemotaxis response regulator protein-glutamate methylesterase, partial [Pseudomonadales bacterium]|nr:chemotaxis response regulator protein-glutamate methylesterase [Pseudomonadales bacterium]
MTKIKVLVIDDSALIRRVLTEIINSEPDMTVIDTASDPLEAREKIKRLNPDVLTLDVEMPKMDGITFLKNLMRLRPMPVIMVSTLTEAGAEITLEALSIGAVDCVAKPSANASRLDEVQHELVQKIRAAAGVSVASIERASARPAVKKNLQKQENYRPKSNYLIAIGASTGGTVAIKDVLIDLPENSPPIVVAQHIPPNFSASYAARMNTICAVKVHEAQDGQPIEAGNVYIAPGGYHLRVKRRGNEFVCDVSDTAKVNMHRPSVDVLFESVAG